MSLSRSLLSVAALASFVPSSSVLAEELSVAQPSAQEQLTTTSSCSVAITSYSVSGATASFTFSAGCGSSGYQLSVWCGDGGYPSLWSRFEPITTTVTCTYSSTGTKTFSVGFPSEGLYATQDVNIIF